MVPTPGALGLIVCDYVLVEEGTRKVSLIGSFRELALDRFPVVLPPFSVYALLSDGSGSGILDLILSRLETDEEIFSHRRPITFADQLAEVRVKMRIRNCSIPAPGYYQWSLLVDGQPVTRRRLHFHLAGGTP